MSTYSLRYLKSRASQFISLVFTISVISLLVSYCVLHYVWLTTLQGESTVLISELKIAATTVYIIVAICAFFSLTQVSRATIEKLSYDFSQWRLLGFSAGEIQQLQLQIMFMVSLVGALIGVALSGISAPLVLPQISLLAAAGTASAAELTAYGTSLVGLGIAFVVSALTTFVIGIHGSSVVKHINPLALLRNQLPTTSPKFTKFKTIMSWICLGYSILLVCCIPLISYLNGGAEAIYNITLHIGISLCIFFYLRLEKHVRLMLHAYSNNKARNFLSALVIQNYSSIRPALNALYIGVALGTLMLLSSQGVGAYVQKIDSSVVVNYADTAFIVVIVVIIAGTTGVALLNLSSETVKSTYAFCRKQGFSMPESMVLALKESTLTMLLLIVQVLIPHFILAVAIALITQTNILPMILMLVLLSSVFLFVFTSLQAVRLIVLIRQIYASKSKLWLSFY